MANKQLTKIEKNEGLPEKIKGRSPISKQAAYSKVASHFTEIFETQLWLMRYATQESVRASMANKLMDKILPDLKAQEFTGDGGGAIKVIMIDYGTTSSNTSTQAETSITEES